MPKFYFDAFDGDSALVDHYGDVFLNVENAAGEAVGLLGAFAKELCPGDGDRNMGTVVRDDAGRDVYKAVLAFRDAYPDPDRPGPSLGGPPTPPIPDPADLIRRAQEAVRESSELRQRLRATRQELQVARERMQEEREKSQKVLRGLIMHGAAGAVTGFSPSARPQAA